MNKMSAESELARLMKDGFVIINKAVPETMLEAVSEEFASFADIAGSRNLLQHKWVQELAFFLQNETSLRPIVGTKRIAVQCTYFSKSKHRNWLVPIHRDQMIPVRRRINDEGWSGWSLKDEQLYARPPEALLSKLLAVRIHFEDTTEENGALQVVAGSHMNNDKNGNRVLCEVPRGGALIMFPQLFHASSKIKKGRRRVLHFLYGPQVLPNGAEWPLFDPQ